MAEGRSLEEIIPLVQEELGSMITRPTLADKLLSKPPFRFLHDIVSSVTKATGFAAELFSGIELDGQALSNRELKIAYLEKIIKYVEDMRGTKIDVRPGKIVAGLEPECTNAFLLELAYASKEYQAQQKTLQFLETPIPTVASAKETASSVATSSSQRPVSAVPGRRAAASAAPATDLMGERAVPESKFVEPDRSLAAAAGPTGGQISSPESLGANGTDMKLTISLLQPLIARPKLTEKLLSKPPFRFLHDIVSNLMNSTQIAPGFLDGVFNSLELDAELVGRERHTKLDWLTKLINHIGHVLNTTPSVRARMVVAGMEADRTNEMLQLLAIAAKQHKFQGTAGARPAAPPTTSVSATTAAAAPPSTATAGAEQRARTAAAPSAATTTTTTPAPSAQPGFPGHREGPGVVGRFEELGALGATGGIAGAAPDTGPGVEIRLGRIATSHSVGIGSGADVSAGGAGLTSGAGAIGAAASKPGVDSKGVEAEPNLMDALQTLTQAATPLQSNLGVLPIDLNEMEGEREAWVGALKEYKDIREREKGVSEGEVERLQRQEAELKEELEKLRTACMIKRLVVKENDAKIKRLLLSR